MIINTDAIVLKTFSYGETSLISRCFTKDKGKISFIIKGAKSKKNLISPYFQPLSFINIIYKENEKRELQIVSKVSFVQIWTKIPLSLRKMSLSQSILEISVFTLEKNDPYPNLFNILIKTFQIFESGDIDAGIQQFQISQRSPSLRLKSLVLLGRCFMEKKLFDLALEQLQHAVEGINVMDDFKKEVLYLLAECYEKLERPEEAIEQFKAIYSNDIGYRDVAEKIDAFYRKP